MLLSVITVNLDNLGGLRRTFESVVFQTWRLFEFIVVDGASSDGSREFIEENADSFSYWVCESDTGVYSAMNKGIKQAKGEYVLFLNSGDCLSANDVLENTIGELDGTDLVCGGIRMQNADGRMQNKKPVTSNQQPVTFRHLFNNSLPHQSTFIRQELFDTIGFYNESDRITSDWQFFMLALFQNKVSNKFLDLLICVTEEGGISRSKGSIALIREEKMNFLIRCPEIWNDDFVRMFFENERELNGIKGSRLYHILNRFLRHG